jgi:hypothetical protein
MLMYNNTLNCVSNTIFYFSILREFSVKLQPLKAPCVKEFIWHPLPPFWVKFNTDRALVGVPGMASCGGICKFKSVT